MRKEHAYYVYIMTNSRRGTLYIGVTNDLRRRIFEHRQKVLPKSFTGKYGLRKLVYFEHYQDVLVALQREKNIKHWSRKWKIELIESMNARWEDLYGTLG